MVTIRLSRGGSKKRPFYHIIVTDSRNRRDGRYIERLGFFNPVAKTDTIDSLRIDQSRAAYWLATGAQPSERVSQLLKQHVKLAATPEKSEAPTAA
jgi:small subunit ribosomal protein S16